MPNLCTITVTVYSSCEIVRLIEDELKEMLADLVSVDKVSQLKLIIMKDASYWRCESGQGEKRKKLLVDWKAGDGSAPQLLIPPVDYHENCCDRIPGEYSTYSANPSVADGEEVSDDGLSNFDFGTDEDDFW